MEQGLLLGADWVWLGASYQQWEHLLAVEQGRMEPPDFEKCVDGRQAIHELVRHLCAPCSLHWDSALAYWESISSLTGIAPKPFVEGFFSGARMAVHEIIARDARHAAFVWVETRASAENLMDAEFFVEQYGDTWQESLPEGCTSVFHVAMLLTGAPPELINRARELVNREPEWYALYLDCDGLAVTTEEFMAALVQEIVDQIQRRMTRAAAAEEEEILQEGAAVDDELPQASTGETGGQRQPRGIRLGRNREAEQTSEKPSSATEENQS